MYYILAGIQRFNMLTGMCFMTLAALLNRKEYTHTAVVCNFIAIKEQQPQPKIDMIITYHNMGFSNFKFKRTWNPTK